MVICLERDADLHMAQLMPLPLTVSCSSEIQIGLTFLVPAHPGSPGKRAVKRVCVCVCVWFGTDRYVSVCHPFQQERFCSRRRPVATIGTLAAIALSINAVQAYFWTYNYDNGDCGLRPEVNAVFSPGRQIFSWGVGIPRLPPETCNPPKRLPNCVP